MVAAVSEWLGPRQARWSDASVLRRCIDQLPSDTVPSQLCIHPHNEDARPDNALRVGGRAVPAEGEREPVTSLLARQR